MEGVFTMHHLKDREKKLAQAYVPIQSFDAVGCPVEAIRMGTAFPSLYRPYEGWKPYPTCE